MMGQPAEIASNDTPEVLKAMKTSRAYELVSAYPVASHDIQSTVALRWLGAETNQRIISFCTNHRTAMMVLSDGAKICAVAAWYTPWRDATILPLLICCMPRFFCTLMLLSEPILKLLGQEFEFWFATTLNLIAAVVFSIEIGFHLTLGYMLLSFLSIQVTILSDADVFTLCETARAGIMSCAYTVAMAIFAVKRGADVAVLPASPQNAWRLASLNLLSNVAFTLSIFTINKTLKRRSVFVQCTSPFVPLTVCRAQLALQRRDPRPQPPGVASRVVPVSQASRLSLASPPHRSLDEVQSTQSTQLVFRVRRHDFRFVDSRTTLLPRLCVNKRLSRKQSIVLNSCGVVGFGFAGLPLLLLFVFDVRERFVLYPCAIISITSTIPFCLMHAAHYQRDLLRLLLHNFDFWFLTVQFATATLCIADLLNWDYRCLCVVTWCPWFNWVLATDAMVATYARKLRFRKIFAALVLFTVLFGIVVVTYSLTLDPRNILHDRQMKLDFLAAIVTVRISTKTVLAYRFVTIWLWSVRLVSRLAKYPEDKLMFLRGAVEYQNPALLGATAKAVVHEQATSS